MNPVESPTRTPSLVLVAVCGLAILLALGLPLGSPKAPGPGMWPLIGALFAFIPAIGSLIRPEVPPETFNRRSLVVVAAIGSLLLYAVLFPLVGFSVATALLLLLWLKAFFREPTGWSILAAVLVPLFFYLLFAVFLGVPLPSDLLDLVFVGVRS